MQNFEWVDAPSTEEALAATVKESAFKAGGVDLMDLMKEELFSPQRLVNIRNVKALKYIKADGDGLKIGPLTTLAELAASEDVNRHCKALALAAGHAATPQVRNMATVGGNLLQRPRCWYFRNNLFPCRKKGGEICFAQEGENQYHAIFNNRLCAIVHPSAAACALVAHGASIEVTTGKGKREQKLEDFFVLPSVDLHRENKLEPEELITEIRVPKMPAGASSAYTKQGEKESFDWPIAEVAVVLSKDGEKVKTASVVLGAAAPVPHRAKGAEQALAGKAVDETVAREAAKAALKGATPFELNKYKLPVFEAVIARTILAAAKGQQEA